jgi:U3 small nucleolar RNA-associated protein 13
LVKLSWLNLGLQLASASVDGVVKIWNVKKQVCMNTIEMHEEKIWAMDFCEHITDERTSLKMITGSSDSKVKIWVDNTVE